MGIYPTSEIVSDMAVNQIQQLQKALSDFDKNGDGKISFFEFVSFMGKPEIFKKFGEDTPFSLPLLTSLFQKIDADSSQFIDHQEFMSIINEKPDGNLELSIKLTTNNVRK